MSSDLRATVMNKFERTCIKNRIIKLAILEGTGTPADLADRFEISERSVKRLVKELRDEGWDIYYDYNKVSYVTKENVKHVVEHVIV
jgi:predicted DNA-binding transcriptional regulator YafY